MANVHAIVKRRWKKTLTMLVAVFTFVPLTEVQGKRPAVGKPTYEETAAFIKNYFAADFFRDGKHFDSGHGAYGIYFGKDYRITDVDFRDDCTLKIEYQIVESAIGATVNRKEPPKTVSLSIDLSLVESIELRAEGEQYMVYGLIFNIKNSPNRKEMDLPFARMEGDSQKNFEILKNDQLYKAFQHMRKLCGAPEPINFDDAQIESTPRSSKSSAREEPSIPAAAFEGPSTAAPGAISEDEADRRLNASYTALRRSLSAAAKENLKREQLQWLKRRDTITDPATRVKMIEQRTAEIEQKLRRAQR